MNRPRSSDRSMLRAVVRSDRGKVRVNNQDTAHAEPASERGRSHGRLFLVADGMGGHAAGEVASRLAADAILDAYYSNPLVQDQDPAPLLASAFQAANARILQEASAHREFHRMGTTCTAALVRDARLWFAHVGDSRGYLFHDGSLKQVTRDHNVVAEWVIEGRVAPQDAQTHEMRHVLTRALGIAERVDVDVNPEPLVLRPGDRVLVCSDGLSGVIADDRIEAVLGERPLEDAARTLVDEANERGGPDNITLVIVEWTVHA